MISVQNVSLVLLSVCLQIGGGGAFYQQIQHHQLKEVTGKFFIDASP